MTEIKKKILFCISWKSKNVSCTTVFFKVIQDTALGKFLKFLLYRLLLGQQSTELIQICDDH